VQWKQRVEIVLRILRRRILKIVNLIRPQLRKKSLLSLYFNSQQIYLYIDYFQFESAQSVMESLLYRILHEFIRKNIFHTKISKLWTGIKIGIISVLIFDFQCNIYWNVYVTSIIAFLLSWINNFHIYNFEIFIYYEILLSIFAPEYSY